MIFNEQDSANSILFMFKGEAAYVLPAFDYTPYIIIPSGQMIGSTDIQGSSNKNQFNLYDWQNHRHLIKRQFTSRALQDCETFRLSYDTLFLMRQDFTEVYDEILNDSFKHCCDILKIKLIA